MDLQMPEMDGYEATKRIRAMQVPKAQKIPIIAMSANVYKEDIVSCLEAGMNDHIGKPIDPDNLFAKLNTYLEK
jgi:CheY-like chemotaxis protein